MDDPNFLVTPDCPLKSVFFTKNHAKNLNLAPLKLKINPDFLKKCFSNL